MTKTLAYNQRKLHFFMRQLAASLILIGLGGAFLLFDNLNIKYNSVMFVYGAVWIAFVGYLWTSYQLLAQHQFEVARINEQQTGVWISLDGFRTRRIYVSFDWLTIQKIRRGLQLNYQQSLTLTRKGKPIVGGRGSITFSTRFFDRKEIIGFAKQLKAVNQAAVEPTLNEINELSIRTAPKIPKIPIWPIITTCFVVLFLGVIVWQADVPAKETSPQTAHQSHKARQKPLTMAQMHHQRVDYQQPGQTIEAGHLKLVLNHIYLATAADYNRIIIMNVTLSHRRDDENDFSISGLDFQSYHGWSMSREKRDAYMDSSYDKEGSLILLNDQEQPVINVLSEGDSLLPTDPPTTVNIVLRVPEDKVFDVLYKGFEYRKRGDHPSNYENPSVVLHIKTNELEELMSA